MGKIIKEIGNGAVRVTSKCNLARLDPLSPALGGWVWVRARACSNHNNWVKLCVCVCVCVCARARACVQTTINWVKL